MDKYMKGKKKILHALIFCITKDFQVYVLTLCYTTHLGNENKDQTRRVPYP